MNEIIKNIFDIKNSKPYIEYNNYHLGNIFGITKVSRWELMHSNFIAWVLNPYSSHSLHHYPLYQLVRALAFIKEKPENEKARLDSDITYKFYDESFILDAKVKREVEHIDISIEIETKEKILPILIENKVDSKENGKNEDQTKDYFKWGEANYSDRDKYFEPIYIFLFPEYNSQIKQKEENYIRMNYQELVDYIIEPSKLNCGDLNSINNFKQYLQCLSFQADNEKGGHIMAISKEEKRILDDFIKENKNLIISVLNNSSIKDEVDPNVLSQITDTIRDSSKYIFEGTEYGKNRLVLAVVKKYVEDNNGLTFKDLLDKFPKTLQGGKKGVVQLIENVSDKDKGIGPDGIKRYFVDSNDIINLPTLDEKVIVCNQWGIGNIDKFIEYVTDVLGYKITKV